MLYAVARYRVSRLALFTLLSIACGSFPLLGLAVSSVTLAWDPPASAANIASYNLYYGGSSGIYTNVVLAGTATNATITALVPGATYYFAATTVDTLGLESDFSDEASYSVAGVNQPPTLAPLADMTIAASSGQQTVALSGISSGATNETQTLSLTALSSNPGLIPNPTLSYTSPNGSGWLSFAPVPNAFGSAIITVTVSDGSTSNNSVSRSFTVYVDQQPTISSISAQVVAAGSKTAPLAFTIGDADSPIASLTLTASSSNPALVQNSGLVFAGSNSNRTITVTPLKGQVGVATITIAVSDGVASANTNFRLTVGQKPTPPGHMRIVAQVN